jgi:hypothetical protein
MNEPFSLKLVLGRLVPTGSVDRRDELGASSDETLTKAWRVNRSQPQPGGLCIAVIVCSPFLASLTLVTPRTVDDPFGIRTRAQTIRIGSQSESDPWAISRLKWRAW